MKKFIYYIISILFISLFIIIITFLGIVSYPKNIFEKSYQSVIQDKYRILKEIEEPKIIMVAGSSSAFGLDQYMLEEATGYKVVNLGLHAGFHNLFYTELTKANINSGDIILLGYEYGWHRAGSFDTIGTELVMSGIDTKLEMYKYIPIKNWPSLLGYTFAFAAKKNIYEGANGVYSREAFDQNGQMVFLRDYILRDYKARIDHHGVVDVSDTVIDQGVINYLKDYKDYVESRGANVYFVSSPILREAVVCEIDDFYKLKVLEEEQVGIKYISDPFTYMYPETLMFDSINHCNTRGEKVRTRQLIKDLHNAGIVDVENIEQYEEDKDNSIIFEYDFVEYLNDIDDENYTIFISAKDEATMGLTDEMKSALESLGLKAEFFKKYRSSILAVISQGDVIAETDSIQLELEGIIPKTNVKYAIISAGAECGNESSIVVDGKEYSRNMRGLNIVVYSNETGKVVDTVSFDTFVDAKAER